MKNLCIIFLSFLLVYGCSGRPPVPVNQYGGNSGGTSFSTSGNRPPLPGKHGRNGISQNRPPLSGQEIFKKCNTAVFMIFTSTGLQAFQGSGFFISPEGIAVSNYHVFEGTGMGLEVIKTSNDQQYKIDHVIFKDKTNDVMVFTVKAAGTKFNFIPVSSRNPLVGEKVYAIGSPRGLENTFSSGEISQFRENGRVIQISVPIDHGSSGGALINEYGEVIGITSGGFDDSGANLNFAVNINVVKSRL